MIITTAVIKGGTGKTTTAAALAQAAAKAGKKVLCVDLDPQANLTKILSAEPSGAAYNMIVKGSVDPIETTQRIDLIPASPDLATIKTTAGGASRTKNALEPFLKKYDYIFIDTPPQLSELTYNGLMAATDIIIPLEADVNSIDGFSQIYPIIKQLQTMNQKVKIKGVILTRYDPRAKLNQYLKESIKEICANAKVKYLGEIRQGIATKEAQAFGVSLFDYAPRSKPAQDYKALFEKL